MISIDSGLLGYLNIILTGNIITIFTLIYISNGSYIPGQRGTWLFLSCTPVRPEHTTRPSSGRGFSEYLMAARGELLCSTDLQTVGKISFSTFARTFDGEIRGNLLWILHHGEKSYPYSDTRNTNFPHFRGKSSRMDVSERTFFLSDCKFDSSQIGLNKFHKERIHNKAKQSKTKNKHQKKGKQKEAK